MHHAELSRILEGMKIKGICTEQKLKEMKSMSHGWRISLHPNCPEDRQPGFLGSLFLAVKPAVPEDCYN